MNTAVIALGSNIEPQRHIKEARKLLTEKFTVLAESKFIKTKPIGFLEQDDFLNGSVYVETFLDCQQIHQVLKSLETQMGRTPSVNKCGPRIIDLDIVIYNNEIVDPEFYERQYLKDSVLELIPKLVY